MAQPGYADGGWPTGTEGKFAWMPEDKLIQVGYTIEELIQRISKYFPVEIHYEPRNEGDEWRVSLVDTGSEESHGILIHEHFGDLREGLIWLAVNGLQLAGIKEEPYQGKATTH